MAVAGPGEVRGTGQFDLATREGAGTYQALSLPLGRLPAGSSQVDVRGLADESYRERARHQQALHQRAREEGRRAWDILDGEAYTHHEDPEVAVSVREVLDATLEISRSSAVASGPDLPPMAAGGPQPPLS